MPAASLLVPPALLAAAAVVGWGLGLAGLRGARLLAAAASWLALSAMLAVWTGAGRAALELSLPGSAAGAPISLRLDSVAVALGLSVLLPASILLSFQQRSSAEAGVAVLATCAALLATEAGSVLLTAVALAVCASLVLLALRLEEDRSTYGYWLSLSAAWLLLLWGAAVLEVTGGTSTYAAAPVTALGWPVFLLVAAAGILCSGMLPGKTWVSRVWERERLEAGTLAVGLLLPLGFLLLTRAYVLGAGRWPGSWLNVALAVLGVLTALAAAFRAQAALDLRGFLAESVPLSGGLALLALALGTPFGMSAAVLVLVSTALLAGLVPLLARAGRQVTLLGIAVAAGIPPALVFGGRLLALQAALEVGDVLGFLSLAGAIAWLLSIAAASRASRLRGGPYAFGASLGAGVTLGISLLAGLAAGAPQVLVAGPVAAQTVASPNTVVSGGLLAVVTPSGAWPALALAGPLLVILAAAVLMSRRQWFRSAGWPAAAEPPEPFVRWPFPGLAGRLGEGLRRARVPEDYRSLLDPTSLESAVSTSRPWLWGAVTLALVIVVTR